MIISPSVFREDHPCDGSREETARRPAHREFMSGWNVSGRPGRRENLEQSDREEAPKGPGKFFCWTGWTGRRGI